MIRAIAAIDAQAGTAKAGHIPWQIPDDRRYFREQTWSSTVLMGRATYERFARPLPGRRNVVASRQLTALRPGFELVSDVPSFLTSASDDVWIIGGAQLYAATLAWCQELYLTIIHKDFDCDQFFPSYERDFSVRTRAQQAQAVLQYEFVVLDRKKPVV